ncbi:MAG: TonB-dependent receptor [Chitinophagaceae bacterium]|nr:TonB-dependent receptor [Chitinophagaceae bacterium]
MIVILSFVEISFAGQLSGIVTSKNKPLSVSASILLFSSKDSTLIKGELSDKNGNYKFDNIEKGEYFISSSLLGYQKFYSANIIFINDNENIIVNINLEEAAKSIKEVSIVSQKPLIEIKADKTVFNVAQSINSSGSNVLDLLRKSPGVMVDKDENVTMRGKNNVLIYIDGKATYLDNKDLASILKNLQSNDVDLIELISNPSAKYDASGNAGIINIKLKKNKRFGTNGKVSLGANQGKYFKQNASISLNNRNKKVNVFGSYSVNNGKNFNFQNFDRTQNNFNYDFKSNNVDNGIVNNGKIGIDYYINSNSVIGVMINGMFNKGDFSSNSKTFIKPVDAAVDKVLIASNAIPITKTNLNNNINYKYEDTSGKVFNIDVDYGNFKSKGESYQPNTYWNNNETQILSQSIYKNITPTSINIYSLKSDYEQNLWKGKFGVGIKSAYVKTNNDFKVYDVVNNIDTLNLTRSNKFIYLENVNAAYINYSKMIKKLSTQFGLRAEQTNSKGMLTSANAQKDDTVSRQYINLFPSAGLSYSINEKNQLGITYSRRIDRPNYQDLNPFENKLDELTYEKGNAFLRPQFTNSIDVTHSYLQAVTTSLSYSHVKDMFMQTTDTTEFSKTYVTQKNFATMDIIGMNISFPIPLKKWWMIFANINVNNNKLSADFEGRKLRNDYYTYTFYAENNITLPKDFSLNVSGWYSGPNYWGGTFKLKPMGSLDMGIQKLLYNKRITVNLNISDIIKTQQWYAISNFSGLYVDATGNYESRQLRLNVSYRFGSNEVARQRERKLGADTENNRIKSK